MKRFIPLFILTGLLSGQDTTIVLENGSTVSGTIISETDSTYRIMGESWRVTDGVYEVFNTFINISKNETEGEAAQKPNRIYPIERIVSKQEIINMSDKEKTKRRDFLFTASYTIGAVGVGAAVWPLIDQMNPDASVKALASTEVDISSVEPGKSITVLWRGKPVFIKRRTEEEIAEARAVKLDELKHPEKDEDRAKNPEWLIMIGVCTHLGCVPLGNKGEYNGWFCPCHGSHYDTSGRIRKGPAPQNMEIPKYEFVNNNIIKIG